MENALTTNLTALADRLEEHSTYMKETGGVFSARWIDENILIPTITALRQHATPPRRANRMKRPNGIDWMIYRLFRWWWNPILRRNPGLIDGMIVEISAYRKEIQIEHPITTLQREVTQLREREQELEEVLQECIQTLKRASRMLTEDHRGVLCGKAWGGSTIEKASKALEREGEERNVE